MKKRRLKKPVVYALCSTLVVAVLGTIVGLEITSTPKSNLEQNKYVDKTIFTEDVPVVSVDTVISKPYTEPKVTVVKTYYDYKGDKKLQEGSLIFYENTYLQSNGISYGLKEAFDVVAIAEGTVTNVKDDQLLGKIVEITHDGNIISLYQSLGEVAIKKGDVVKQGSVIGKSGVSNVEKDLGNHLRFELIIKGQTVNPEEYYNKKLKDL